MKKILLAIAAAWVLMCPAQNNIPSATLQHGASRTVFYGNSAFAAAYQAAADTLDVIYLSSGTFTNPGEIKKSITVYGVGFEADPATNVEPTAVRDNFIINPEEGSKTNGIHLEGIYFYNDFQVKAAVVSDQQQHVHHLTLVKCSFNNLALSATSAAASTVMVTAVTLRRTSSCRTALSRGGAASIYPPPPRNSVLPSLTIASSPPLMTTMTDGMGHSPIPTASSATPVTALWHQAQQSMAACTSTLRFPAA